MDEQQSRTYPIQEDMPFQRRSWIAERIGWVAIGLLLLGALSGVFALGPLAYATASSRDGSVVIEYARFVHKTARTWFTIRVARSGQDVLVRLSPQFSTSLDMETLDPHPLRSSAGEQGSELVFPPAKTGDLVVHIGARPKAFGFTKISVEVEGRGKVEIEQFIYP